MTAEDVLIRLLNAKTKVRLLVGTFVSVSATGCQVDVGGGRIDARFGSGYLPQVNEPVNVWMFDDDSTFVMGPTTIGAPQGTVVSVSSGMVTLTTDFGTVVAPYFGSTPAAGQVMGLRWHGGPQALGVLSTSPPTPTPPPPPDSGSGAAVTHVDTFQAGDAGSWNRNGWQQAQVWASDSYSGAWFYGSKIADTIPAGSPILKVEIFLSVVSRFGSPPNFGLHAYQTKPAGQPSYSALQPLAVTAGWFALPTGWGDSLRSGGGQAGVGVNHGGKNIFASLAQDGMSGALRITSVY